MPFTIYKESALIQPHSTDPCHLPIFLIPGILGNDNELRTLAEEINTLHGGKTPIYIYNEPIINGEPQQLSLDEHAGLLAQEIISIRGIVPTPDILIGYSFGGQLASEVARKLQSVKRDPRLYVIDEPSVACVQQYLNKQRPACDTNNTDDHKDPDDHKGPGADLISIVNYAAKLSGLNPITLNTSTLQSIEYVELDDALESLKSQLNQLNSTKPEELKDAFNSYIKVAKRNLNNILMAEPDTSIKLNNVHLILTKETARKYTESDQETYSFKGNWDDCSNKVTQLNPIFGSKLSSKTHMELLNEENAPLVAGLITKNIQLEVTSEHLLKMQILALLTGKAPQEQIDSILRQLSTRSSKRSSAQFFKEFTPGIAPAPVNLSSPQKEIPEIQPANPAQAVRMGF